MPSANWTTSIAKAAKLARRRPLIRLAVSGPAVLGAVVPVGTLMTLLSLLLLFRRLIIAAPASLTAVPVGALCLLLAGCCVPEPRPRLLAGEHGVEGDCGVHRRHAHLVPGKAEVRAVDVDLAVQPYIAVGARYLRVHGHRAGLAADGQAAGHCHAPVTGPDAVDGDGDVRVLGDVEEVRRAQVVIPLLVVGVHGLGGHGDRAGRIASS